MEKLHGKRWRARLKDNTTRIHYSMNMKINEWGIFEKGFQIK